MKKTDIAKKMIKRGIKLNCKHRFQEPEQLEKYSLFISDSAAKETGGFSDEDKSETGEDGACRE